MELTEFWVELKHTSIAFLRTLERYKHVKLDKEVYFTFQVLVQEEGYGMVLEAPRSISEMADKISG